MSTHTMKTGLLTRRMTSAPSPGNQKSSIAVPPSKWTKLASEVKHGAASSEGSDKRVTHGSFSWKDVAFNRIPIKKKSDDLCAVLLAQVDRSAIGQRDPSRHFMSKFDMDSVNVLQDLLVCSSSHYFLSTTDTDLKLTRQSDIDLDRDRVSGIVSDMVELPWNVDRTLILVPSDSNDHLPNIVQMHQLIRELVVGIYVFNQLPELDFVPNFERSTVCQLSPAYQDTTIGQAIIDVAYMANCLRYGCHFDADNRQRFNGEWRSRLSVNVTGQAETKRQILLDFLHAGLQDITQVPGYCNVYDGIDAEHLCPPADKSDFLSASIDLHFSLKQVYQEGTVFIMVPDLDIVGRVAKLTGAHLTLRPTSVTERVTDGDVTREHLRIIEEIILTNIDKNEAIKRSLEKLKLVACLIPLLVGLKRRNKIPNLAYLVEAIPRKEMMTERELPPLMASPEFKNRCYQLDKQDCYFGLNGGVRFTFECSPTSKDLPLNFEDNTLRKKIIALNEGDAYIDEETSNQTEDDCLVADGQRPLTTIQIGHHQFGLIELRLENFIAKNCRKPLWANQLHIEMTRLRFQILPLTTSQLNGRFHRIFGPSLEFPSNDLETSTKLHVASEYKLASVVHALLREVHSDRLELQNADGWSSLHSAVYNDAVHVVEQFKQLGLNVNTRRFMYNKMSDFGEPLPDFECTGSTPLHLAARFGSVNAVSSLLFGGADAFARDNIGWLPIHYAAHYDQMPVTRLLLLKHSSQMKLTTDDRLTRTPLLLCSVSGALQTLRFLLSNGSLADCSCDIESRNVVHLATLHYRIHVLKYLVIHGQAYGVKVWETLSEMLKSLDVQWQISAIKCIGVLMTCIPECFNDIVSAGLPDRLVSLMKEQPTRQSDIVVTLSTMSFREEVQRSLLNVASLKMLVKLMHSDDRISCSKAASIISDIALAQLAKDVVGQHDGFQALSHLLATPMSSDDILISSLKAVASLCLDHKPNKDQISNYNLVEVVVGHLHSNNDKVRLLACSVLTVISDCHTGNQSLVVKVPGALQAIRHILFEQNKPVLQKKAAKVVRALAQNGLLNLSVVESGIIEPTISLLKGLDLELKEEAAQALWAMAGTGHFQHKSMAHRIGTTQLINMLLSKSEILISTCCPLLSSIVYEDLEEQNQFVDEGGLGPLLLLIGTTENSVKILEGVMRTLSTLCLGVDFKGNRRLQLELSKRDLLKNLVVLFTSEETNSVVRAETLRLIACLTINRMNEVEINSVVSGDHRSAIINQLLHHEFQKIRLCTAEALALFACNKQWKWGENVGVTISLEMAFFDEFLKSNDERHQCMAAYLIALLAQTITDKDTASCTVVGIQVLSSKLDTSDDDIFILTVSLLCSLSRGRMGVVDSLVALGLIELLLHQLNDDRRRRKCASTLACLSHHRLSRRRLFSNCRRRPDLYDTLVSSLPKAVDLSRHFVNEFEAARRKGLPSEW